MRLSPIVATGLATFLVAGVALGDTGIPPANAPLPVIAKEFLKEIAESKARPIAVKCVTFPSEAAHGVLVLGRTSLRGNVMSLSKRWVCEPLATLWRSSPTFTGNMHPTVSLLSVLALDALAHEWFHTRGVSVEERTECHAVQYTWKYLRRSLYSPTQLGRARRFLLSDSWRPAAYKIPSNCLGPT